MARWVGRRPSKRRDAAARAELKRMDKRKADLEEAERIQDAAYDLAKRVRALLKSVKDEEPRDTILREIVDPLECAAVMCDELIKYLPTERGY